MAAIEPMQSRLERGEVVIMDGGTGTEIERRGIAKSSDAWSGQPLLSDPDAVRVIHEDYLRAGAEIIIANTFSTGRASLVRNGLGDRTVEINTTAVRLAREARDNVAADQPVVIAGSMSTFIPKLEPAVIPLYEGALTDYREQSQVLAEAGVDVIVAEMIVRTLDARAAAEATAATGLPFWLGLSCVEDDGRLFLGVHGKRGSESIVDAIEAVSSSNVSMVFIMHSQPEYTGSGLSELKPLISVPMGVYAHTGRYVGTEWLTDEDLSPQEYATQARGWVNQGAQVVGGCCGTTPEHIQALKDMLPSRIPG